MSYGELLSIELSTVAVALLAFVLRQLREIKQNMATKEDAQKLETALNGVKAAAENIAADTAALKEELKKANENSAVDLSGAIATAEGIEARLRAIAGSQIGSDPEDKALSAG